MRGHSRKHRCLPQKSEAFVCSAPPEYRSGPLTARTVALGTSTFLLCLVLAAGRALKCLTVVDDATQEAVTIAPDRAISGADVTRILDGLKRERGLPQVIRSDNGRLRDECLNEHWFTSLPHARAVIEEWRRDYNEQRAKKDLGGLPPAAYAAKLALRANQETAGSVTV